ncbi:MAG TPA: protein-glutamate O-methyltransferase CheR [Paucimonas sp.]|nr:protein-glutamate O-methyltransferase CheR [Paucimonas sp.]
MAPDEIESLEIHLLLEAIRQAYDYDFHAYAEASLKRRLRQWLADAGYQSFSHAQGHVLRDRGVFDSVLRGVTVNVTEMFRDPAFFRAIREHVVPYLRTYPFVKIWHAGCATGEEAYSMAILLHEAGMQRRFRIYATDINEDVLTRAQEGIFPMAKMQGFTRNYQKSGGQQSFSDYYTARYEHALLSPSLKESIVFSSHNLAVDGAFGEMHMILCRNVMIYFKPALKERCFQLFDNSIVPGGFLCLGQKERLDESKLGERYHEAVPRTRIYRKRYDALA